MQLQNASTCTSSGTSTTSRGETIPRHRIQCSTDTSVHLCRVIRVINAPIQTHTHNSVNYPEEQRCQCLSDDSDPHWSRIAAFKTMLLIAAATLYSSPLGRNSKRLPLSQSPSSSRALFRGHQWPVIGSPGKKKSFGSDTTRLGRRGLCRDEIHGCRITLPARPACAATHSLPRWNLIILLWGLMAGGQRGFICRRCNMGHACKSLRYPTSFQTSALHVHDHQLSCSTTVVRFMGSIISAPICHHLQPNWISCG